jgi:hypothetical protein
LKHTRPEYYMEIVSKREESETSKPVDSKEIQSTSEKKSG